MKNYLKQILICVSIFGAGFADAQRGHSQNQPVSALQYANGAIHAFVTWETGPSVGKESLLRIEWRSGIDGLPIEPPGDFSVVLWMPSMGHGSAPTKIQPYQDAQGRTLLGIYHVSNIYFMMGGDWDVNIALNYQKAGKETRALRVALPRSGKHH